MKKTVFHVKQIIALAIFIKINLYLRHNKRHLYDALFAYSKCKSFTVMLRTLSGSFLLSDWEIFTESLENSVRNVRSNERWKREYMHNFTDRQDIWEEAHEAGVHEGLERGIEQGIEKGIEQKNIDAAKAFCFSCSTERTESLNFLLKLLSNAISKIIAANITPTMI